MPGDTFADIAPILTGRSKKTSRNNLARLYSNENFPLPVVQALRSLGHDVLTVLEAGHADRSVPDEEVLAFAFQENRILLTHNRKHFIRLHADGRPHAGIIACTVDIDFVSQANRIHDAMAQVSDFRGVLFRVNKPANSP